VKRWPRILLRKAMGIVRIGCKRYAGVDAVEPREANGGMSHWGDFQPAAIPFVPSPLLVAKRMLEIAELQEGETLLDLGSGDGRILIAAIEWFGAKKAIGVEIREDLVRAARKEIRKKGLEDRVSVIQGDLFQVPIDETDVVALYLTAQALNGLRPKLESQLKQGTRIVCHDYEIKGWTPAKVEKLRTWRFWPHKIYLYVVQ
jgi:SAM-dependent methyltransferase